MIRLMSNQEFPSPDLPADAAGVRLQLLQYAEIKMAEALAFRARRLAENNFEAVADLRAVATLTLSLVRMAKLVGGPGESRTGPGPAREPAPDDIDDGLLPDDLLDPLKDFTPDDENPLSDVPEGADARRPSPPEPLPCADGRPSTAGDAPAPESRKMGSPAARAGPHGASRPPPPPPRHSGFLDPRYSEAARAAMTARTPPGG